MCYERDVGAESESEGFALLVAGGGEGVVGAVDGLWEVVR